MAEATCRRELELEIPAEEVSKATEKVAKELMRVARVPGFRPGKAPITLIKKRFAEDIKGEVLQSLVPETVEKAVAEQKLTPVSQPQVDKLDFTDGQPVKFRAVFEVLPEFELGDYKNLEIEMPAMDITDEDVDESARRNARARGGIYARRRPRRRGRRLCAIEIDRHPGRRRRTAASRQRAVPCWRGRDDGAVQRKSAGREYRRPQGF